MAAKSKQKQLLSRESDQKSKQDEQTPGRSQNTQSQAHGHKTQRTDSMASQKGDTLLRMNQPQELPPPVRSAQNIALLELLDPRPPSFTSSFQYDSTNQNHRGRNLSRKEERELATNMAFLAGVSECPEHVMAVCIEELPSTRGCRVMLAINKRLPSDGNEILERVQRGFEKIFGRLGALSVGKLDITIRKAHLAELLIATGTQARAEVKETVFTEIIELCQIRILSRLRSRHSEASYKDRNRNKRFFGSVLQEFMARPWQERAARSGSSSMQVYHLKAYRSALENLSAELDRFETKSAAPYEDLPRLVRLITQVIDNVPIEPLIGSLTNQDMQPQLRKWLLSCFKKIRRYSEVASSLCHRARRHPMLRNARVETVTDVVNPEVTPGWGGNIMDIDQSLARFKYVGETIRMGTLPEWLRCLAQRSMNSYQQNVRGILEEAKVHAEIQLLAHYESEHSEGIRPRLLASSKNACALCNAVIVLHGQYSVPKSHGKLYRGWRLPVAQQCGPIQDSLNTWLEDQISETLARLIALSRLPPRNFDNESSIFSFNLSASALTEHTDSTITRNNVVGAARVDCGLHAMAVSQSHVAESAPMEHAITYDKRDAKEQALAEDDSSGAAEHADRQANANMAQGSNSEDSSTTSLARQPIDIRLEPGQEILFRSMVGGIACFRSRSIELLIDEASSGFSCELLCTEEAEAILRDDTKAVADVRTISPAIESILPKYEDGQVYISHGKEVIRICARPG